MAGFEYVVDIIVFNFNCTPWMGNTYAFETGDNFSLLYFMLRDKAKLQCKIDVKLVQSFINSGHSYIYTT